MSADPLGLMSPKKRPNKMSMKERRQKLINDRADRLARDAKKQGITPEQLLKKRRDTYINVVGGAAMGALPFAAILRAANVVYKGFTGAKAAATGVRVASKTKPPVATSAKKTPAKKTDKPASQQVIEGKATVVKPTSKPGTQVATQGSRAVKKPGTGVQQVRQVKDKKPPMKNVTPKKKALPNKTKPAAKKKSSAAQKAALGVAALAAVTGMVDRAKDKKAAAAPTAPPKRPTAPKAAPKAPPKRPKVKSKTNEMMEAPKKTAPKTTPKRLARDTAPKASPKSISAGGNTGFGPKGNIFPGNAKERAALMLMYGGTGSAAAKAAAAGKQGNMKLGRKALDSAKKERLSKKNRI